MGAVSEPIAPVLRRAYPVVLGRALRFAHCLPDAEDAVQEAIARALVRWPAQGVPDSPEAWLSTVAKNVHRDRLRKAKWESPQHDTLERLAEQSPWARLQLAGRPHAEGWRDELLRLLFACCHPALEAGEAAALSLATILGMSTTEVAAAFLAAPRTMEQRLMRARRRLRESGDLEFVSPSAASERLDAVLRVIHLLFNEGYWSTNADQPIRAELCGLALELGVELARAFPEDTELGGLLVLMILHDARRAARQGSFGPTALPDQDRSLWDWDAIAMGIELLNELLEHGSAGPYLVEAGIVAVHCQARTSDDTDWTEIARLYALLEQWRPTPAVRVNHAFAAARATDPQRGLALLDDRAIDVDRCAYVHLVRGTLLEEAGRPRDALDALRLARSRARNDPERREVEAKINEIKQREETNGSH